MNAVSLRAGYQIWISKYSEVYVGNQGLNAVPMTYNESKAMARPRLLSFLSLGTLSVLGFSVPLASHAASVVGVFNPIIAQSGQCLCIGMAPSWGCILQTIQNVVNVGISVGVVICVLYLAYAGVLFMMSGANPGLREQGKTRIMNGIIGMIVVLSAWIVVDFVMKTLYNPSTAFSGQNFGPWNNILASNGNDYCIQPSDPMAITTGSLNIVQGSGGATASGDSGTGATGGSCTIPSNGACSIASLQGTCFGARAAEASRVCNLESGGGNYKAKSGSDKLDGGSGASYSIGLWQINLTTSQVGGLNCPAAFTRACQGSALVGKSKPGACNSSIKDQNLYNQCVAAAQDPAKNDAVACSLYSSRGFQPWSYSSNKCGVSYK